MNKRKQYPGLLALITILVAPCAAVADDEASPDVDTEADTEVEKVCLDSIRVRNFDGLSDFYLYVEQSRDELYLITMRHRCIGLRNANVFVFKDGKRRICSDDNFAEIVIRDMGRAMSCNIGNIERVESKEAAKAIVEEREQARNEG